MPLPDDISRLLESLQPSPDVLADWLRPRIDDSLLHVIAEADYGMDAVEHFAALKPIRDTGEIPAPLLWKPKEVCDLIRWSEPEDPQWKPGLTGEPGHLIRTFCCEVLLRAAADPKHAPNFHEENSTLISLVASVLTLGQDAIHGALRLVAWRIGRMDQENEELPFMAMALVLLVSVSDRTHDDGQLLTRLAAYTEAEENAAWVRSGPLDPEYALSGHDPDAWLFRITYFDTSKHEWRAVTRRVLLEPQRPHPPEADAALRALGARLVEANEK